MSRLRARSHIAHDADYLLQRCCRRAHAEDSLDLEPHFVDGEVAVARDDDEPVDVALQERLVPVRVAVELLRVAEVRHRVHLLPELERVDRAVRRVGGAQGGVVDSELSAQIK